MSNKGNPHMDREINRLAKLGGMFASDPAVLKAKRKKAPKVKRKKRIMEKYTHSRPSYYKGKP